MDRNFSKQVDAAAGQYTKEKEYWLNRLAGEPESVGFQPDYSSTSEGRKPAAVAVELPEEIVSKLIKLGNNSGLRLYIAVTAGLTALLHKYTGRDDVIIGAPIFKQPVEGQLINTVLTLRNSAAGNITFRQLLMQVSRTLYEANENQNYPIETLLYKLNIPYQGEADFPLFDAAVLLENLHERKYLDRVHLKMIFSFAWQRQEGRIRVKVEYDAQLYREDSVKRIIKHFIVLLEAVFRNMDLELGRIDIVPEEEKKQLLEEFNAADSEYPHDKSLHRLFAEQAARTPDGAAVFGHGCMGAWVHEEMHITYRELNKKSDQSAHVLREKGVLPGDIVGITAERSVEVIIGLLGILKSGAAYLPIDPEYPEDRIDYMLKDSNARVLVSEVSKESELSEETPTYLTHLTHPTHLCYIIYTSGTTGNPKAVMIEHRNAVNTVSWFAGQYGIGVGTHVLQTTDCTFDPSVEQIFGTLLHGASLYLISKEMLGDLHRLRRFIAENQVHVINFVPMLLKELLGTGPVLGSLRAVISGGDRLEEETKNIILEKGYELFNHYGPSEITVDALAARCSRQDGVTLGKPISNVRCYIVDQTGLLSPVGVVGELLIGGGGVARGYLNNPDLTAEKFDQDLSDFQDYRDEKKNGKFLRGPGAVFLKSAPGRRRLYRTGDLARWLANGHIEFLGRIDHQVKIRGYRIELGEIESQMRKHPLVSDVVVAAFGETSRYLCAYMVLGSSAAAGSFSPGGMREYLALKLPSYMVPSYFIEIERIPLTSNGKIDRKALPLVDAGAGAVEYAAPRNEIEEKLAALWSEVLEVDPGVTGIDTNFFESGGHSLNATVLVARMHKELNVKVPMVELFRAPTIRGLSLYIKGAVREGHLSLENAEKKEYYPLSSAQERLYILQSMDETGITYNLPAVMELRGDVDKERIEEVFLRLMRRHESFRTSFEMVGGEPVQKVHDEVEFEIEYFLATEATEDTERKEEIIHNSKFIIQNSFIRPFDLTRAPLLRMGLLRTGEVKHVMMLDMHHIITDGVSMGILVREFSTLYASHDDRLLPELQFQYIDYSEWQRKMKNCGAEAGSSGSQAGYWFKQFEGEIPILGLPTDFARPAIQSFEGHSVRFELDREISPILEEFAGQEEATLFMVLLAAYNILLYKLSGQEDLIVGTPTAGRRHIDYRHIIGMFVNTLALRNYPAGEKSFNAFLKEVKKRTLAAFENQDYQFEDLVEEIGVTRDIGRNPLFDTVFSFENMDIPGVEIPGLTLFPVEYENSKQTSRFDISLIASRNGENFSFVFEYCTQLFKRETIERFIAYFKAIISSVLKDPGAKTADMEIIPEAEKRQILYNFNDTMADYPGDRTIHRLFAEQVEKTPDYIALVGAHELHELRKGRKSQGHITYRRLNRSADQLAYVLREKGVLADNIVGIMVKRSIEMMAGILGILKAGGAYLPIDPDYPPGRIDYMLKDSKAAFLLTDRELSDICRGTACCDPAITPATYNLHLSLAYVIYTSGSTGTPKGVMIEHHPVVNRLSWMQGAYPIGSGDMILQKTPTIFDVSVWELFWWGFHGAGLCLLAPGDEKDPPAIVEVVGNFGVTTIHFVPSMLNAFLSYLESAGEVELNEALEKLKRLRQVFASGETLDAGLVKRFYRLFKKPDPVKLINLYGPTEATVDVSCFECSREGELETVPIGKPIHNTRLYVLNGSLHLQPIGVTGELYIAGVQLARGYLNNPELTAEKFVYLLNHEATKDTKEHEGLNKSFCGGPGGSFFKKSPLAAGGTLYKTGDLARWLADGNIEFLGRLDRQVKIRGFRIELGEIEKQLTSPGYLPIKEAVVTADPGPDGDNRLIAYVVPDETYAYTVCRQMEAGDRGLAGDISVYQWPNGMTVYYLNRMETDFMYHEIFEERSYLKHGITLRKGACIFDIGANIGVFSLFALRNCKNARIYAFEPLPPVYRLLSLNTSLYRGNFKTFNCGIGSAEGEAFFTYYPHATLLSSRFADSGRTAHIVKTFMQKQEQTGIPDDSDEQFLLTEEQYDELLAERLTATSFTCPMKTLSRVIEENGVESIDLLKIDVEKSEMDVLEGIRQEHWPRIKQLVIEVHESEDLLRRIKQLLEAKGYSTAVEQELLLKETRLYNLYAVREPPYETGERGHEPVNRDDNDSERPGWYNIGALIQDTRDYLKGKLPGYMVPAHIVPLAGLPLTPNGKVDRKALPAPEVRRACEYVAPGSDKELEIAAVWQQVLGLDRIGIDDNFFDVGGNSIKIIKLSVELKNRLGIEIPVAKMFQYPTIASLARYMTEENSGDIHRIKEIERDEEGELANIKSRLKQRRNRDHKKEE